MESKQSAELTKEEDLFLTTYNSIYVKNLSISEKSLLIARIRNSTYGDGDKRTLESLLNSRPCIPPKIILGPTMFYIARKNGMNIYLFGEHHYKTEREVMLNCDYPNYTRFVDFLTQLEGGKCFFDVFIESEYLKTKNNVVPDTYNCVGSYTINSILNRYKHCFDRNTRTAICDKLRFHYSNIRNFNYSLFDRNLEYDRHVTDDLILSFQQRFAMRELFRLFSNSDANPNVFISFVLDNPIVKNQLERSYLKNRIKHYIIFNINNFIKPTIKTALNIFNDKLNNINRHPLLIQDSYSKITDFMKYLMSQLMDAYLLARLFRVYTRDRGPDRTYNAIIYTGQAHTKNILHFLKHSLEFNITKICDMQNDTKSCMNINGTIDDRNKIFQYQPITEPAPFQDLPEIPHFYNNAFDYSQFLREGMIEYPQHEPSYISELILVPSSSAGVAPAVSSDSESDSDSKGASTLSSDSESDSDSKDVNALSSKFVTATALSSESDSDSEVDSDFESEFFSDLHLYFKTDSTTKK